MKFEFLINELDNIFHIIDALSEWSPRLTTNNIKETYIESYNISTEDKDLLEQYAEIRKKTGWRLFRKNNTRK